MTTTPSTRHLSAEAARSARRWYIVDAEGQVLGRLASRIASVLRGKNKAAFSPHVDAGDFVVVVNAAKVRLTGRKLADKLYIRHSGYPGSVRRASAVEGMLPKNRLGRRLVTKLKVYAGPVHPHQAQKPSPLPSR